MKLSNFVFGLIIFSIVTTIMFGAVQSMLTENRIGGAEEWAELSGNYSSNIGKISTKSDSTSRAILGQTEQGVAGSETQDVTLLTGAVSGGRLTFNFFTNFNDVANKVRGDTDTFVDPRIWGAIIALALVFLLLVGLHFLRGFKTEV